MRAAVRSDPLDAGDRNPNVAKTSVTVPDARICTPLPMCIASEWDPAGALNTSPLTIFHPLSSAMSVWGLPSTRSCSYFCRSRRIVRIMIIATMQLMTTTTIREFMMENQCTLPPGIFMYASQRLAHVMSDVSQYTSYVYAISAPSLTS